MAADRTPRPGVRRELLALRDVAALLGVGLSTAERLKAAGRIGPRPVNLAGPKWPRRELLAWLAHPGPDGRLLTATEWPPVWADLRRQRQAQKSRR